MARNQKVISTIYPRLKIQVNIRGHRSDKVTALLDTGFTGNLAIPTTFFNGNFGLPDARIEWELADGRIIDAPVYLGTLEIIGTPPIIVSITALGDEFILGRGVIDRFKVIFDHGKRVTLEH